MRRLLTVLLAAIVSTTVVLAQSGTGTTQLVGAEYFYDTDPGYGQATYINNVTEGENSLTLSVDGLSPGAHMLCVRSLESSGLWSATQSCPILLTPQRADNVARVEYFFDTDPGYGLGSSVSATNGENVLPLSISGMAAGIHHLNMRSQDAAGNWSPTLSQSLFIVSPKNANVQRIEYFFDTDPGYGQATAISGALAADATYALPLDGLAIGSHLLCVRAQDNHGRWSSVVSTPLFVTGRPANAVAAEYFLDANDPGVGQATPVTLPADLSQPFVIAAATDGLNPGEHTITIRVLNDLGFWTTVVAGTTFTVTEPTVVTPEPYAVLSADSLTVTFYYDSQRASRSGAMDINTSYIKDYDGDSSPYGTATQAIIDPSFADYRPTSTYCWFQACDKLVSVSGMEYLHTDNVTDMRYMFYQCSNLTSLDVSHFNTENVNNMSEMFRGCSSLTSLDVSGFNTANVLIMVDMFGGCSGLTSLDVSRFNTASVWDMSEMFGGCSSLTSLDVSGFNTANVTNMSGMFRACSGLTSLDVSGFNTAYVTYMSDMFCDCSGLTSLDVSGFNTENVTNMIEMFAGCSGLTSLDVSGFNTANVRYMSFMFRGCSGLTSLDVSGFNTANVTSMFEMFSGCTGLTNLDVSGFNTANVKNMRYMFDGCSSLTSLDVSGFNTANVTDMSEMFSGCSNLVTIYAGEGWSTANVTDGSLMFRDCANLVGGAGTTYDANHVDYTYAHIDGGESNPGYLTYKNATPYGTMEPYAVLTDNHDVIARDSTGVTYGKTLTFYYDDQKDARGGMSVGPFYKDVWSSWYNQRESITTAEFDPSFANCTTLTSTAYWFYECKNLVSISGIQYLKTANVMDMQSMFGGCSGLTSLDVSGFNTAKVTYMGGMFYGCSSLTSLDVRGFNTANVMYMGGMFQGCLSLTSLDVSGFNTANMVDMGGMFRDCSGLTSLDVTGFNTANVWYMDYMFRGCSGLTSLDVSGFNTANVTDMSYMFSGCSNLVTIYAGEGWSTANVTDGSLMFSYCANLVGGAGTTYDANHVDYTYAHIDGGTSNPGYLTDKNASSTYKVMIAVEGNGEVSYGEPTTITGGREVETTVDAGGSLELFFFPGEGARLASVMVVDRDVTADVTPASENGPASYILNDINNDCWIKVVFENVGPVGEAEFDGLVARVSGERTLDEAFAEVGGRFEAAKTIAAIVWNKDTPMTDADLQGFNNPNMLVYVENPSFAPSSAKNVVVNGRIQSLVLTDEGDNNNFFAPQPFTAEQISYTHEYIQQTQAGISRGWESIALPFTVQTITHESHGQLRPFALSGSGRPFWLRQLTSNGIIDVTGIEANTPYIISMPNNPTYRYDYNQAGRVTFAAVNATVESSYDTRVMSHENIEMVPAFYAIATGNNCYAINRSEPREGYPEGSVFELNLRTVRPFEAYTLHLGNNPLPRFLPIADMNTTTGIADITSGAEGADVKIYSLSGVIVFEGSLSEAQMKLPAGVYIIDGKKTLIK